MASVVASHHLLNGTPLPFPRTISIFSNDSADEPAAASRLRTHSDASQSSPASGPTRITSHIYSTDFYRTVDVAPHNLDSFLDQTDAFCARVSEKRREDLRRGKNISSGLSPPSLTRSRSHSWAVDPTHALGGNQPTVAEAPAATSRIVHWLAITGLDVAVMQRLRARFALDAESCDAAMTRHQMPSVDGNVSSLFSLMRLQGLDGGDVHYLLDEQLAVFFVHTTPNGVPIIISVHETDRLDKCFERVRGRLRVENSRLRRNCDRTHFARRISFRDCII